MAIEELRWWHIPELLDLEADLFGDEQWSAAMFWSELAHGGYYRIAREGGRIVGYAGLAPAGPDQASIQNIAVRRDRQRRGVGEALLTDLLAEAERQGATQVFLEVAVDNEQAQALYRRHGFRPVGVRRGYYQPSNTDALTMARASPATPMRSDRTSDRSDA
ncbi:MAG: ribosomal-protein-alanine N-acetyltransferase [Micromonosporaceae bacterium]|nr:ribosomal-protein-alanine N-acetyltransferase [Micromonosporaceae bacterium]